MCEPRRSDQAVATTATIVCRQGWPSQPSTGTRQTLSPAKPTRNDQTTSIQPNLKPRVTASQTHDIARNATIAISENVAAALISDAEQWLQDPAYNAVELHSAFDSRQTDANAVRVHDGLVLDFLADFGDVARSKLSQCISV